MSQLGRTRNYATVLYLESAAENWRYILEQEFVPCFISPYHDKDINADGSIKKPHFHIIIMFDSVKSIDQAKAIFDKIGGVGCEKVNSIRGYARYLCHLDNQHHIKKQHLQYYIVLYQDYLNDINI